MPKPDPYAASISIACSGPGEGTVRPSPLGPRRSRDGADLAYAEADAAYWHSIFSEGSKTQTHSHLQNPTSTQVIQAIAKVATGLERFQAEPDWTGGQINLLFAGHGSPEGRLVVQGGQIGASDFIAALSRNLPDSGKRKIAVVLDCCHSARFLSELLADERHSSEFLVIDGFAACLHDESAWEFESLGHGALTFAMRNRGNEHVDQKRLAQAVKTGDESYLRYSLQAFTPNPVTYLTQGDQTAVEVINGFHVTVQGGGEITLDKRVGLGDVIDALERARDADLGADVSLHGKPQTA